MESLIPIMESTILGKEGAVQVKDSITQVKESTVQAKEAGDTGDEAARIKLQDAYRAAADSLETPNDVWLRLFNTVSNNVPWSEGL
jgi:hypothetical protein